MTNNQLKALIERIERLEAEKATVADDIKEVYSEAKGTGFDPKIIKKVIAIRKRASAEVTEEQALIDTYMSALGMLADTPFKQAVARVVVATMDQGAEHEAQL
jgi:uncharacterized protein (UPF0335 family)